MNFHASFAIKPALEWSFEADDIVRDGYHKGKSYNAIAHDLRRIDLLRSGTAVIKRCERLKLPFRAPVGNTWIGDKKKDARELWESGLTGSQVAEAINAKYGTSLTRNAVIGLSNREGWTGRERVRLTEAQREVIRENRLQAKRDAGMIARASTRKPVLPPAHINDLAIPQEQRRTIFELGRHHCRWPVGTVGEPDFFFCGATKAENSSYCPGHKQASCC